MRLCCLRYNRLNCLLTVLSGFRCGWRSCCCWWWC